MSQIYYHCTKHSSLKILNKNKFHFKILIQRCFIAKFNISLKAQLLITLTDDLGTSKYIIHFHMLKLILFSSHFNN